MTLAVPGDPTGVPDLVKLLRTNIDLCETPRGDAAYALGKIGEKAIAAVPHLIDALREDPVPQVRQEVVLALGMIKSPEAIPAMLEALQKDKVDWMRGTIAQVLADFGAIEAIAPIKKQLKRSISRTARSRLALALSRLEEPDGEGRRVLLEMMDRGELESYEIEKFNEKVPQHPLVETDAQKDARLAHGWLFSAKWALEHGELDTVLGYLDQSQAVLKAQNNTRKLAKTYYLYA